jgi:hypothetical protein
MSLSNIDLPMSKQMNKLKHLFSKGKQNNINNLPLVTILKLFISVIMMPSLCFIPQYCISPATYEPSSYQVVLSSVTLEMFTGV